ncbi:MAG: glutamate-cysteine ligase family protein [Coriobacteriales bacterium]|jgi:glutamate--cysteine ligase
MGITDYHEANRRSMVEFFEAGSKQTRRLGFELEHSLVHKHTGKTATYDEPGGVCDVLMRLSEHYDEQILDDGNLIGLSRPGEVITLEPAAQLEISAGPYDTIPEIELTYLVFRRRLEAVLEEFGLYAPLTGYNPVDKSDDLEIIPKFRYERMNEFLGKQSPYGQCMMRGSASLQVSIDFANERDAMRKLRISSAIAPILALITDNAPVFEGEPRKHQLVRTYIWSHMHPDRVGTVPGIMRPDFTFADYADYVLSRQAILIPGDDGWISAGDSTFDDLYANRRMTKRDIEHALSMVWPDVRLKSFVEIRPADAMPFEYSIAYTALIKNLFYDERNLRVLEELLEGIGHPDVDSAKKSLFADGYQGRVYGRPAHFWADELLLLASGSATREENDYLEPLQTMVGHRFTLAGVWKASEERAAEHCTPAGTDSGSRGFVPRIGILPRYDFEFGDVSTTEGYMSAVIAAGGFPFVLPHTGDPALYKRIIETSDGFVVPGGHDIYPSVYGKEREAHLNRPVHGRDEMESTLIPAIIESGKPLLGICRGMQMINVACGGTLHQHIRTANPESEIVHMQERPFNRATHSVSVEGKSILRGIVESDELEVNSMHHQCVDELGDSLRVSAVAHDGTIEAIESTGPTFVLGVQWHPELLWRTCPEAARIFKRLVREASRLEESMASALL